MKSAWLSVLFWTVPVLGAAALIDTLLLRPGDNGAWPALPGAVRLVLAAGVTLWAVAACLRLAEAERRVRSDQRRLRRAPTDLDACVRNGLGPVSGDPHGRQLYLDLIKRVLCNTIYEDDPLFFYDGHNRPREPSGFELSRRVQGEDYPRVAHTMIGLRRLGNIQFCVEDALARNVPGDLIDLGVLRGGSAIMLRAVLKAYGVRDRRVFACDTFASNPPPRWAVLTVGQVLKWLASIPGKSWHRRLYLALQRWDTRFPRMTHPSDEMVELMLWFVRHPELSLRRKLPDLDAVKSNFARYGMLDEQVVFLQGFFAETLPAAPIGQVAVMRLDGDTYESTRDGLELVYPKLAPGGYCIIDDYHSFPDCRLAVEEYRMKHNIADELAPIDDLAVYWKKSG